MEVLGSIIVLNDAETVGSAGTFKKRLVVVETDEQYKQKVGIDFVQDKTALLDTFKIGDKVKVSVNVRGQEYNGKYYVSLNGWKISKEQGSEPAPVQQEEESDMPF